MAFKLKSKNEILNLHPDSNGDQLIRLDNLPDDVYGYTDQDKTIWVNQNKNPKMQIQAIQHEKKHVEQINKGKLWFDDNFYYWKQDKGSRQHRIPMSKIDTADHGLPWEKEAYKNNSKKHQ
jgi:hypothetical protein